MKTPLSRLPLACAALALLALAPQAGFAQGASSAAAVAAAGTAATEPADAPEAPEPPPSLMFTLEEQMIIEAALREGGLDRKDDGDTEQTAPKPRLHDPLYLSGILYEGPDDWTVWLNGQTLRPGMQGTLYDITEVTDRYVLLTVAWGEETRQVLLEPNQTFLPRWEGVVEGRAE